MPTDPWTRALKAIGLVVFVVLFNLGLYVLIGSLLNHGFISGTTFPALVLFLSFALSLGIILIVAIGETIDTSNIENEWIKKIGVTPILTIVAVILGLLAGFSPFAKTIISDVKLEFMLANVGVTCLASDPHTFSQSAKPAKSSDESQATHLLTVVTSKDKGYITQVKQFLTDKPPIRTFRNDSFTFPDFQFVSNKPTSDEFYKLLRDYADSPQQGSDELADGMNDDSKWVAYSVRIRAAKIVTNVPVPTIFDKNHTTFLFIVLSEPPPEVTDAAVASLNAPIGKEVAYAFRRSLRPLFQVEIEPNQPIDRSEITDLNFKVFADQKCWNIGR